MAWYIEHHLRYRGRLVAIVSRYGCFQGGGDPRVVKGKPLDLSYNSRDYKRLERLFYRDRGVKSDIQAFRESCL